jgi:hypothetical protein
MSRRQKIWNSLERGKNFGSRGASSDHSDLVYLFCLSEWPIGRIAVIRRGENTLTTKFVVLLFGLLALGIPFAVGTSNILNHFYLQGSYLFDSGLLAHLMTHRDSGEPLPLILGNGSFYQFHVSPIFWLLAELSDKIPLSPPQFFASFVGTAQALLAAGVYWALVGPVGLHSRAGVALAALLAIAFSNSGLAIAILRYPHFEVLIAAAAVLFLVALSEERYALASLFLVLALLTREDAGFHLASLLATILVIRRCQGSESKSERIMLVFLSVAALYSVMAMALQRWAFPDDSSFTRIYAGEPPFAHVTSQLLITRLLGWSIFRSYAMLPAGLCILWAIIRRNPSLAIGYISTLPWLAIHLVAISPLAGTLSSYYAFPLLVASFWPLFGTLEARHVKALGRTREAVIGFAVLIAATFTAIGAQQNPNHVSFSATFALPPSPAAQRAVAEAVASLTAAQPALGIFLVSDGIASLAPDAFAQRQSFWFAQAQRADTVAYFEENFQTAEARCVAQEANELSPNFGDGVTDQAAA